MIKVFICDDIEEIRIFFKNIINSSDDMEVVGTAGSGDEAIEKVLEIKPDIVLMDIQMETKTAGIDAVRKIYKANNKIKNIMLTVHDDDELIVHSYVAGAVDYITKFSNKDYILDEIRKIYSEEILIGSTIAANIRDEFIKTQKIKMSLIYTITKWSTLTRTEQDIIRLVSEGYSRRDIAKEKGVEISTIKTHINNILKKFEYSNTNVLIENLKEIGIIDYLLKKQS